MLMNQGSYFSPKAQSLFSWYLRTATLLHSRSLFRHATLLSLLFLLWEGALREETRNGFVTDCRTAEPGTISPQTSSPFGLLWKVTRGRRHAKGDSREGWEKKGGLSIPSPFAALLLACANFRSALRLPFEMESLLAGYGLIRAIYNLRE